MYFSFCILTAEISVDGFVGFVVCFVSAVQGSIAQTTHSKLLWDTLFSPAHIQSAKHHAGDSLQTAWKPTSHLLSPQFPQRSPSCSVSPASLHFCLFVYFYLCVHAGVGGWVASKSYVAQAGPPTQHVAEDNLRIVFPLPPPPECWGYRNAPLCIRGKRLAN